MRSNSTSRGLFLALAAFVAATLVSTPTASAQHYKVLYSFQNNGTDGHEPNGGIIVDPSGNLYGTTYEGGAGSCSLSNSSGCGTVFELTPSSTGSWTETILHNFSNPGSDGFTPATPLLLDKSGNLYGSTASGGSNGYGIVYELSNNNGVWTEQILHNFNNNGVDGTGCSGALIFDKSGNLYGTTEGGGSFGGGTAFKLSPAGGGAWTETILYSFYANATDGLFPVGGPVFDSTGNLYGLTLLGGDAALSGGFAYGTAFELIPQANGTWNEEILHSFGGVTPYLDGFFPNGPLVLDTAGNLYGTTHHGGAYGGYGYGNGTIFQLSESGGSWTENIINNVGSISDFPTSNVIFDGHGNLYGATIGNPYGPPAIFECGFSGSICGLGDIHIFGTIASPGYGAIGNLTFDRAGNLYGQEVEELND